MALFFYGSPRWDRRLAGSVAGALSLWAGLAAQAQDRGWVDEVGSGFGRHRLHAALTLGVGAGESRYGSHQDHDLALATAQIGWVLTDLVASNQAWRGNLELLGELFAGSQYRPHTRALAGTTLLLRYNFVTHTRWIPYVEIGAGPGYTDIGLPDASTKFQFNDQLGLGTHYFFRPELSVTASYRFLHLSNAGIEHPNRGVNTHMFQLGVCYWF